MDRGFPGGTSGKECTCRCKTLKRCRFDSLVGKIPWRMAWQPTPVFSLGESQGQGSLAGWSPQNCKESDTSEATLPHTEETKSDNLGICWAVPVTQVFTGLFLGSYLGLYYHCHTVFTLPISRSVAPYITECVTEPLTKLRHVVPYEIDGCNYVALDRRSSNKREYFPGPGGQ